MFALAADEAGARTVGGASGIAPRASEEDGRLVGLGLAALHQPLQHERVGIEAHPHHPVVAHEGFRAVEGTRPHEPDDIGRVDERNGRWHAPSLTRAADTAAGRATRCGFGGLPWVWAGLRGHAHAYGSPPKPIGEANVELHGITSEA